MIINLEVHKFFMIIEKIEASIIINSSNGNIITNILSSYSPTKNSHEEKVTYFNQCLFSILSLVPNHNFLLINVDIMFMVMSVTYTNLHTIRPLKESGSF